MLGVAAARDVPAVVALYDDAARWLVARGIRQWRPGDRPAAYFAGAAREGRLLVWREDGAVVGAVVVTDADGTWESSPPGTRYLHALVVDRARAGLGRRVLAAAEDRLRAGGAARTRLDCVAGNAALRAYYRAAGYAEVGTRGPVALFEKALGGTMPGMGLEGAHVSARLPVADLGRAREWYATRLGLEPAEERPGGLLYTLGGTEFALYESGGRADGSFTQLGFYVADLEATVTDLRERGVVFEEYDLPGLETTDGIADIEGNYPSRGSGERAAWFRDLDGNMLGVAELVP